jgi:tetratricopeptide (TPR) repeat protein
MFSRELARVSRCVLGPNCRNREILILLYNFATACAEAGDEETAIYVHQSTLQMMHPSCSTQPFSPDVMMESDELILTLQQLGILYQRKGLYEDAVEHYESALRLALKDNKICSLSVAKLWNSIGNLQLQMGRVPDDGKLASSNTTFQGNAQCFR